MCIMYSAFIMPYNVIHNAIYLNQTSCLFLWINVSKDIVYSSTVHLNILLFIPLIIAYHQHSATLCGYYSVCI